MSKKCCATKNIYRYTPPVTPGVRAEWWDNTHGPHLDPLEWNGPEGASGFPNPVAAPPDVSIINTALNVNDSNSGLVGARYGKISFWYDAPVGALVRDFNGNTGELGMVLYASCCNGLLREAPGGNHTVNTSGADRYLMDPTPVSGMTYFCQPSSDLSAAAGFLPQVSLDGGTTWTSIPVAERFPDKPQLECIEIPTCQEVPEGWTTKPLPECCDPVYIETGSEVPLSSLIPIPDNEVDTAIRTGLAGTTGEFSDAGHNHPIRRQANPGDPVVTMGGTFVETQNLILDRGSDEESYWWRFRIRVSQVAGNNWGWVQFPTIAGFQQPVFMETGGYMNPSISVQDDDGTFGASPRGPYMDYPIHHWSSTNRLYGGYFRRDNDVTSLFINAVVKYTRL